VEFDGHEYDFGFARDITARKRTEQELRRVKKGAERPTGARAAGRAPTR